MHVEEIRRPQDRSLIITVRNSSRRGKPQIFTTFQNKKGRWHWHSLRSMNVTSTSGEDFDSRRNAERAMRAFVKSVAGPTE